MEFNFYQLIEAIVWVLLITAALKFRNKFIWIIWGVIAFTLLFFSPLKMQPQSINRLESTINRFENIPEKIIIENKSFEDKQSEQMNTLKEDSEEIINEI